MVFNNFSNGSYYFMVSPAPGAPAEAAAPVPGVAAEAAPEATAIPGEPDGIDWADASEGLEPGGPQVASAGASADEEVSFLGAAVGPAPDPQPPQEPAAAVEPVPGPQPPRDPPRPGLRLVAKRQHEKKLKKVGATAKVQQ